MKMFELSSGKIQKAKKVVIYGPEGVGKSSLAAQFPNPVFIDTEGSTTELDVRRFPKPTSWEMIKQQVQWAKQQGASQIGSLVIDTIDWAEMQCTSSVCAQHGKSGIEQFGWGHGYTYVAEEYGLFLNLLSDVVDVGIHVVLLAHSKISKFDQPDEMGSYDRYQLKLGAKTESKTAALTKEWADMVLFINYKTFSVASQVDSKGKATKHKAQGGVRTVYATHHPAWDAKNRHGLPDEFPLDYSHIAHIFSSPVSSSSPVAPAETATSQPSAPSGANSAPPPVNNTETQFQPPQQEQPVTLDPNIPRSLRDLMAAHQVAEIEIQTVVSQKGYYPMNTPIVNYDPNFIDGVLVGAWPKVFGMIQEMRNSIPFK